MITISTNCYYSVSKLLLCLALLPSDYNCVNGNKPIIFTDVFTNTIIMLKQEKGYDDGRTHATLQQ